MMSSSIVVLGYGGGSSAARLPTLGFSIDSEKRPSGYVVVGEVYSARGVVGEVYRAGQAKGEVYDAGAITGEVYG